MDGIPSDSSDRSARLAALAPFIPPAINPNFPGSRTIHVHSGLADAGNTEHFGIDDWLVAGNPRGAAEYRVRREQRTDSRWGTTQKGRPMWGTKKLQVGYSIGTAWFWSWSGRLQQLCGRGILAAILVDGRVT